MARADLLCDLIKYGVLNDPTNFRKAAKAICVKERLKQHTMLAHKIERLLKTSQSSSPKSPSSPMMLRGSVNEHHLFSEKTPQKLLEQLILPDSVRSVCQDLITEH